MILKYWDNFCYLCNSSLEVESLWCIGCWCSVDWSYIDGLKSLGVNWCMFWLDSNKLEIEMINGGGLCE